jgi:hypothetical protein
LFADKGDLLLSPNGLGLDAEEGAGANEDAIGALGKDSKTYL